MEPYLLITQINDFMFCPRSIYFADIYKQSLSETCYHQQSQKEGLIHHTTIDTNTYSSKKNIITGLTVYSEKYNIVGRIDILDKDTGILTERKYSITAVYPGFKYQLYAQYIALQEMGYVINELRLYSLKDNKVYNVPLPDQNALTEFSNVISQIRNYKINSKYTPNPNKCKNCIYNQLCDLYNSLELI